jgi:hypothetical protein
LVAIQHLASNIIQIGNMFPIANREHCESMTKRRVQRGFLTHALLETWC